MNKLPVRVFSAIIALSLFFAAYFFYNIVGISIFVALVATLASWEYINLVAKTDPKPIEAVEKIAFVVTSLLLGSLVIAPQKVSFTSGVGIIAIGVMMSPIVRFIKDADKNENLDGALKRIGLWFFGYFYVGLIPGLIIRIINLENGVQWMITLMAVVFAGDTLAYFTGILIGKTKILPNVSPKKTVAGCTGGLFGSMIAGVICNELFFHISGNEKLLFFLGCLIAGFLAQTGDFFESLLKRVAGEKDSGRVMPGHGGALDRIDGILFAAPVVFWLTHQ